MTDEEWDALSPQERRNELVRRLLARGKTDAALALMPPTRAEEWSVVRFPFPFAPEDYAGLR